MFDGQLSTKGDRGQTFFTQNMLCGAGSPTSVTPKRSKRRQGGLVYSQLYSSVKGLYDATKRFPFSNDAIEELALDPQIRSVARRVAGGHRHDAKILEAGCLASKRRNGRALQDSRRKSFGICQGHRVCWNLFLKLKSKLQLFDREDLEIAMDDCPPYA